MTWTGHSTPHCGFRSMLGISYCEACRREPGFEQARLVVHALLNFLGVPWWDGWQPELRVYQTPLGWVVFPDPPSADVLAPFIESGE